MEILILIFFSRSYFQMGFFQKNIKKKTLTKIRKNIIAIDLVSCDA